MCCKICSIQNMLFKYYQANNVEKKLKMCVKCPRNDCTKNSMGGVFQPVSKAPKLRRRIVFMLSVCVFSVLKKASSSSKISWKRRCRPPAAAPPPCRRRSPPKCTSGRPDRTRTGKCCATFARRKSTNWLWTPVRSTWADSFERWVWTLLFFIFFSRKMFNYYIADLPVSCSTLFNWWCFSVLFCFNCKLNKSKYESSESQLNLIPKKGHNRIIMHNKIQKQKKKHV